MYLLNKIFQLREKSHEDHEKPFLEHLEDLRKMIFRIVITLLVSVIICFTFQKQLMDVLRRPVDQVWVKQMESRLPLKKEQAERTVDLETWEKAKAVELAISGLNPQQKADFFRELNAPELEFHAKSVALLRAVKALPEDKRNAYLSGLGLDDELRKQVLALDKLGPDTDAKPRGNLRMMSALKPTETFMLSMKLSFFAGIVLAFPLLLLYILQFVLPGLHSNERRVMWPAMAIGFGLFLGGVLFAYFQVLPRALNFFYEWGGGLGIENEWRIGWYISFATQFTLLFGVAFELPVVVMVFVKLGLLSYETMSNTRSYAIVGIMVLAAVLTPTPDVMTLTLMAAPMILLYEICIWLAWFDRRKSRQVEAEEARERAEWLARNPRKPSEVEPGMDALAPAEDADAEVRGESPYDAYEYGDMDDGAPDDYDWDKEYGQYIDDDDSHGDEGADAENPEDDSDLKDKPDSQ